MVKEGTNILKAFRLWTLVSVVTLGLVGAQKIEGESAKADEAQSSFLTSNPGLSSIDQRVVRMGLKKTHDVRYSRASWYGGYFHGRTTANMEIFNKELLTAAHKTLPLNTYILVTNLNNGKEIVVRVNDRGPYVDGRDIDLSEGAAKQLGSHNKGVVPIKYEVLAQA